jgi:urease accessory protein
MMTLTQRLPPDPRAIAPITLALTAEERTRSRHRFETSDGQSVYLHLPRGTVLRDGDLLQGESDPTPPVSTLSLVRIIAKPELVLTVKATHSLDLLRAAYHLGNRHISLEIRTTYLRFLPDPVLQSMLEHLGLEVILEEVPFEPELGAYGHHHAH